MIDRYGLLMSKTPDLLPFQEAFAQRRALPWSSADTSDQAPSLLEVIQNIKPEILVGASGQPGLFTRDVITSMSQGVDRPIIFPLSNPTSRVEATPTQVLEWTDGAAIVATGSPFDPVTVNGEECIISQCNNSYIFPGLGLGVIASKAQRVTDDMLMTACDTLANASPLVKGESKRLLPPLDSLPELSAEIAFAVGQCAQEEGLAQPTSPKRLMINIKSNFWNAKYRPFRRIPIPF